MLYTQLQTRLASSPDQASRTRDVLQLLMGDTGAAAWQLLVFGEHGLFAAAAVNQNAASPELLTRAAAYVTESVDQELETVTGADDAVAAVLAAELRDGDTRFSPVLLWDGPDSESPVAGVALLTAADPPLRAPRRELIRIVSRYLLSAGDSCGLWVGLR